MAEIKLEDTYRRYRDVELVSFRKKYKPTNWRGQSDFNAVAHALTSAGLAYNHGFEQAGFAGELREIESILFDEANTTQDSLRDNFNNKVGLAIAKFALENRLPETSLAILTKDALDRGLLAVSPQSDPRVNWYGAIAGRDFKELFDGPSPATTAALQQTTGVKGLKAGVLTGPGLPAKDLGLTGISATPKPSPGSPKSAGSRRPPEAVHPGAGALRSDRDALDRLEHHPSPREGLQGGAQRGPQTSDEDPRLAGQEHPAIKSNPFDLKQPDLRLQAALIERSPALAAQLILSAGRKPRLFGL